MNTNHPARRNTGFTLLEIIVSITILALIALMLSLIFSESTRAIEQSKDDTLLDETARMLLDTLEQDIGQALIRTNVPFRIHSDHGALYLVSTGARRQLERIPRDTAPLRIQFTPSSAVAWTGILEVVAPDSGTTSEAVDRLILFSDYYSDNSSLLEDFQPAHSSAGTSMSVNENGYTESFVSAEVVNHAVLTHLYISVNGDADWYGGNPLGNQSMPRFVDLTLSLAPSSEVGLANIKNSTQHLRDNERIYTRRIFLRNTGTDRLTF